MYGMQTIQTPVPLQIPVQMTAAPIQIVAPQAATPPLHAGNAQLQSEVCKELKNLINEIKDDRTKQGCSGGMSSAGEIKDYVAGRFGTAKDYLGSAYNSVKDSARTSFKTGYDMGKQFATENMSLPNSKNFKMFDIDPQEETWTIFIQCIMVGIISSFVLLTFRTVLSAMGNNIPILAYIPSEKCFVFYLVFVLIIATGYYAWTVNHVWKGPIWFGCFVALAIALMTWKGSLGMTGGKRKVGPRYRW